MDLLNKYVGYCGFVSFIEKILNKKLQFMCSGNMTQDKRISCRLKK